MIVGGGPFLCYYSVEGSDGCTASCTAVVIIHDDFVEVRCPGSLICGDTCPYMTDEDRRAVAAREVTK